MKIFTTKEIEKIYKLKELGLPIKRSQTIEYRGEENTRKKGILFAFSQEELLEYTKCATDIVYFIEKYCKTMTIDGMRNIELYGFQKEILKNFKENRYNIFFTSRQVGITSLMSLIFLHFMTFNIDKHVACMDIDKKYNKYLISKIKDSYKLLPFFLKQGISTWSNKQIKFENGSSIGYWLDKENLTIGYTPNVLYMCNFSRMKHTEKLYENLMPIVGSRKDYQLIIHSGIHGNNMFYDLVTNSERPEGDPNKNLFKTQRIYWWQVPGRDEKWKSDMIKLIGEELWNQDYDLQYKNKN